MKPCLQAAQKWANPETLFWESGIEVLFPKELPVVSLRLITANAQLVGKFWNLYISEGSLVLYPSLSGISCKHYMLYLFSSSDEVLFNWNKLYYENSVTIGEVGDSVRMERKGISLGELQT